LKFKVRAHNRRGWGGWGASSKAITSSGKPLGLSVADPDPKSSVGATTQVGVSWSLDSPNGPKPMSYSVVRSDGKNICSGVSGKSCTDDTVKFDGTAYSYKVTATNATGGDAHSTTASSKTWNAVGTPDDWGSWKAEETGTNGTVKLTYDVPNSRGGSASLTLLNNGGAFKSLGSTSSSGGDDTYTVSGLSNGTGYGFALKVCNENNKCSTSAEKGATPFGPLSKPVVHASAGGTTVDASGDGDGNGATATLKLYVDGNEVDSASGKGNLHVSRSVDVGYSHTATVTVKLTTGATTPGRGDGGEDTTTTRTPDPPRSVSISKSGNTSSDTACTMHGGGSCPYVAITTSGMSGGITCSISDSVQGQWGSHGFTAPLGNKEYWYYGLPRTVWVTCDGVESNHVAW
jgi:hypothetical protein